LSSPFPYRRIVLDSGDFPFLAKAPM